MRTRVCLTACLLLAVQAEEASPDAEFSERAARLAEGKDPKAWLALADFAEEHVLRDRRTEALRKALELSADLPEAHARLDEVRFDGTWLPADEAEEAEAAQKREKGLVLYGKDWIPEKEAESRRTKDGSGMRWKVVSRVDTPRFAVLSACSLSQTRRMAGILENAVAAYVRLHERFWRMDPKMRPVRVHLFADRKTFTDVLAPLTTGPPSKATSAFYHAGAQTLYACWAPDEPEDRVISASVHECVLGLDELMAHQPAGLPPWAAEGKAEAFGFAVHGRQVLPGLPRMPQGSGQAGQLQNATALVALEKLCGLSKEAFQDKENGVMHNALSWGFVNFLLFGERGRLAPGFRTFLAGPPARKSPRDLERALGRSLKDLQEPFQAWVRDVFLPAAQTP